VDITFLGGVLKVVVEKAAGEVWFSWSYVKKVN
jgi:hypothetical protein